jgi:hypothetical protein
VDKSTTKLCACDSRVLYGFHPYGLPPAGLQCGYSNIRAGPTPGLVTVAYKVGSFSDRASLSMDINFSKNWVTTGHFQDCTLCNVKASPSFYVGL